VFPFYWYFTSALPRALRAAYLMAPLGVLYDRRLLRFVVPAVTFICLYSILPHKELRFITYVFPVLNLAAAIFVVRM